MRGSKLTGHSPHLFEVAASHFPYRNKSVKQFFLNWIHPVEGLKTSYRLESSLRVEAAALPVALVVGQVFKLDLGRRLKLLGVVFAVILVELLNTSTEELVRDNHPRRSAHYKRAMDASAAAVMLSIAMAAIGAVYVVWDGVRARYIRMSDDELDYEHSRILMRLKNIQQTRLSLGRNAVRKIWLRSRRAYYAAHLSYIKAAIKSGDS